MKINTKIIIENKILTNKKPIYKRNIVVLNFLYVSNESIQ